MSREIKFRAWDKDTEAMWFSGTDNDQEGCKCIVTNDRIIFEYGVYTPYQAMGEVIDSYSLETFEPKPEHIMQYTGLKDNNKKEIYEGDILECHEYETYGGNQGRISQTFRNAVVGFDKGNYYYYPKGNMKQAHQLLMFAYQPVVIGNIYENPKLIK